MDGNSRTHVSDGDCNKFTLIVIFLMPLCVYLYLHAHTHTRTLPPRTSVEKTSYILFRSCVRVRLEG